MIYPRLNTRSVKQQQPNTSGEASNVIAEHKVLLKVLIATFMLLAIAGCSTILAEKPRAEQTPVELALGLENNGALVGSMGRRLSDQELKQVFDRLGTARGKLDVTLNVYDACKCPVQSIEVAVNRLVESMPFDKRGRVRISIITPFHAGDFHLAADYAGLSK